MNISAHERPGDFSFPAGDENLIFTCPCGCGSIFGLMIHRGKHDKVGGRPRWQWNGDKERPTLHPSVDNTGTEGCSFHGWLKNGEWV